MKDICNFVPAKGYSSDITYYHFVYETELKSLRQPFLHRCYYLHLVARGTGKMMIADKEYPLDVGTVFITSPYLSYNLTGNDSFAYLYISFDGNGAASLLESYQYTSRFQVYPGLEHIIGFWMESIRRFSPYNANAITESVFMYTLSYLHGNLPQRTNPDKFELIIDFLSNHFQSKDLTLKSVAELFFYSEKYLSSLFKQKMNQNFSKYLNEIRIQHAVKLIVSGTTSIEAIASECGYSDPMYFSKVFKKLMGKTPREYIKQH